MYVCVDCVCLSLIVTLFQYSFDEATQKATETIPIEEESTRPYVIAVIQHLKMPFKNVISLVHSLVMSVRFWRVSCSGHYIDSGEAVIPPVVVESQDAVTIGKAILLNVEARVCGIRVSVREWIRSLVPLKVKLPIVLMSADSASANLSCMHALRALPTVALRIFSYWHFEP